jgi:hypothetical protein
MILQSPLEVDHIPGYGVLSGRDSGRVGSPHNAHSSAVIYPSISAPHDDQQDTRVLQHNSSWS